MKKASEVLGLSVLGIKEGAEKGITEDFMINAERKSVEYLILKSGHGYELRAIPIEDVLGIGEDYVMTSTIENAKMIYESQELLEIISNGFSILGAKLITNTGNVLGTISEFTFEESDGSLITLTLENGDEYDGTMLSSLAGQIAVIDLESQKEEEEPSEGEAPSYFGNFMADAPEEIIEEEVITEEVQPEDGPTAEDIESERLDDERREEQARQDEEEARLEKERQEELQRQEERKQQLLEEERRREEERLEELRKEGLLDDVAPAEEEEKSSPLEALRQATQPKEQKNSALEEQSASFLLGKTVKNDVVSEDGAIRLAAGTVLTQEVINMAKQHDLILTLTLNV
ncbi:MAG: hypothetical protein ACOYJB_05770 [Christensenellaceae bacterium]